MDTLYSMYGQCINGTISDSGNKGQICGKKYKTGAFMFPDLDQCMKDTESKLVNELTDEANKEESLLQFYSAKMPNTDCIHERIYQIVKHTGWFFWKFRIFGGFFCRKRLFFGKGRFW